MKLLQTKSRGKSVGQWQTFLIGQGFSVGPVDGSFGVETERATRAFQAKHQLRADGIVGDKTFAKAMSLGFSVIDTSDWTDSTGPNWPAPPKFGGPTEEFRRLQFGTFRYEHKPLADNPEHIVILDNWAQKNIVSVAIPQLAGVKGAPGSTRIQWHRRGVKQLERLFKRWEKEKELDRILTWGGSFVPRFIRGSRTKLSNHAYGTAFDINVEWNGLGVVPALLGREGCLRELVSAANELGFYWGGHYKNRPDGMHFEIVRLI